MQGSRDDCIQLLPLQPRHRCLQLHHFRRLCLRRDSVAVKVLLQTVLAHMAVMRGGIASLKAGKLPLGRAARHAREAG